MTSKKTAWDPSQYVSYSSMTLHRKCPQAWAYKNIERLTEPETEPRVAADLGSWWHALRAADSIVRGTALGTLRFTPQKIGTGSGPEFTRVGDPDPDMVSTLYRTPMAGDRTLDMNPGAVLFAAQLFWDHLPGDLRDFWLEKIGEPLPDRLHYMDARWREQWAVDIPNEGPVAVELKFKRTLPGTTAVLPGYIDEVYLDEKRGLVVVRDHKTSKKLDAFVSSDDLMDSQLHNYAWGAAPQVKEWGHQISALSYDRIRSVPPKAPVLTAAGSLSKGTTDYDAHTYREWAAGPDGNGIPWGVEGAVYASGPRKGQSKSGVYTLEDDVLARLEQPSTVSAWFVRTLVPINRNVILSHLKAAAHTQKAAEATMVQFAQDGEAPRNLLRDSCKWCEFAKLCKAQMIGGPRGDYPPEDYGLTSR